MYVAYNPNPLNKYVDDCSVRAIAKALSIDWDYAYDKLANAGKTIADMQNSNVAIDLVLRSNGFVRFSIPNTCPFCYSAKDFCDEHKKGTYVLCFGSHIALAEHVYIYIFDVEEEIVKVEKDYLHLKAVDFDMTYYVESK